MVRFAAIDCGTNSLRLLISEVVEGKATELVRTMEIVRLGEGVDATGRLSVAAIARTRAVLETYADLMLEYGVSDFRMVATSATRDAENKDEFFRMTGQVLGRLKPGYSAEVISGQEEAALSFRGAVIDLSPEEGPFCVIDLGGGSTEFIVGQYDGTILGAHSAQMGCVRVTERIMRSNPPTETEIEIAQDFVMDRIAEVCELVPVDQARVFVGCAGTFTTLAALALGLEEYNSQVIHCSELRIDALRILARQLVAETTEQRAANPVIHPGRADVISGGSVVVQGILDMIEKHAGVSSILVSEKDILDGLVAGLSDQSASIR
ncbi:Ppx/GppA phosphatase family protein [Corynebacterium freiburgense]|uniref:Ppx/GppA phosphatase family protein n=1 Tax=Corynebacterium freiburgense TaxID=556548 RepID=UPI0003FC74D5|nr:Ppx/GppA phosphatase family protein [Corynebacterium freiburgense]WJZ02178.1 Guanosine-5'-triphosphate,3'-diphosphate pyrophosphatase [Corynebacterium freiburgense]